ncbi:alpha/beta hydrolase [Alteromonas sp. H39]|uniref:alpha/beta hydrolase n=1 Tax=Alteromonas sp. H39 TaxID=3389876 RepID=UPI0039E07874
MRTSRILLAVAGLLAFPVFAAPDAAMDKFAELYQAELGTVQPCREPKLNQFKVCSPLLRNEGNAPFMLYDDAPSEKVAVLVHGLSDSPFFMREIARIVHEQGYTVLVPLLPGHGLRDADEDMEDWDLAERWQSHIDDVMAIAHSMGKTVIAGGFSTGGALVVQQALDDTESLDAVMLFSGALALTDNAESMSRIWGIKLLARVIDGSYITYGPNPYKYPSVAGFAGLELMDIIDDIRAQLEAGKTLNVPLFAAHSQADNTTPIHGVENLMKHANGDNTFFVIDESYQLCHADLVVNSPLLMEMRFNRTLVNETEECAVPKANPLFRQMQMMLESFLQTSIR